MSVTMILWAVLALYHGDGQGDRVVHITTSAAIDQARLIARNEGYNVGNKMMYTFDLLTAPGGGEFHPGYTSIGFDINGQPRNVIAFNNRTGQAIDYNTCEVFEYPNVKPFEDRILGLSGERRKSPEELARDVGCSSPKVLRRPVVRR